MKKVLGLIGLTLSLCLSISGYVTYADDSQVMEKTLVVTQDDLTNAGATILRLLFEIGGAKVNLTKSTDENIVVQAVVKYSEDNLEPSLTTNAVDGQYTANFKSGYIFWPQHTPIIHEWEITIGNYNTETNLNFALGGVLADLDLGGMPLKNLTLELGGVGMSVDFSSPTTRSVENVMVTSGGVYLAMLNIGNTDFSRFVVSGGGCAFDLDFHGSYSTGNHDVAMMLAADSLMSTVPIEAGEQVKVVSMMAPVVVRGEGWEKVSHRLLYKEYITDDYDSQDVQLDFNINATTASIILDRN